MWRAFFLGIGISSCLLGMEAMAIEKAVVNLDGPLARKLASSGTFVQESTLTRTIEVVPPEWAPWTLISVGVVVILYSFSIPRRVRG
jgi:hypothetical protein